MGKRFHKGYAVSGSALYRDRNRKERGREMRRESIHQFKGRWQI